MLTPERTTQFKRDLKMVLKSGKDPEKLKKIIVHLANQEPLPAYNRDHSLQGDYKDCRECHIEPDWLLIYMVAGDVLKLVRTGSHSNLF